MTIIPLRLSLLKVCCDQPESHDAGGILLSEDNLLPYLILLRAEFGCFHSSGSLDAPVPAIEINALDILSVPLFLTLRWRGVTPCAAFRSPDFPPGLSSQRLSADPYNFFTKCMNVRKENLSD